MGYYNSGTSAHRNSFYATGSDYNKMMMQAEMTAEAFARHNPNIDVKAFVQANANAMYDAVSRAMYNERRDAERAAEAAEERRRKEAKERQVTNMQNTYLNRLERLINDTNAVPANLPTSYEDAVKACEYIRKNNAYLKPWDRASLTQSYRNLLQTLLNKASTASVESYTRCCVNAWKDELRLLKVKATYHCDLENWEDDFKQLVS